MSARRLLSLVVALTLLSASGAMAQFGYRVQMSYDLRGDSVVAVKPGVNFTVDLLGYDPIGYGIDSFAIRIPFDPAKLAFVGAIPLCPDSTPINVTSGSGFVLISTPSCGANQYNQPVVRLTLQLLSGVTDGTIAGMQPLAFIDNYGYDRITEFATDFVQICHATGIWGDIDSDDAVNSRDALIALSNAVGIPTGAFNVALGDVDADGQVSSRDALAMLSASIGLSVGGFRVGLGIADACAPQPTFPRPLYFMRGGSSPGVAGVSGLAIRAANDSSFTVPGDSADAYQNYTGRPRVSPDGASVLFVCYNSFGYPVICKANADGSAKTELTGTFTIDQSPDWSPAGDSIVFVSNNGLAIMAADGSGLRTLPGPSNVSSVAWKPGSRTVAFSDSYTQSIHLFDLDTGGDLTIFSPTLPGSSYPGFVDFNAPGDSIYFQLTVAYNYVIASIPAVASAPLTIREQLTSGGTTTPAWTDQGLFFAGQYAGTTRILLAKPDGTFAIVSHDTEVHYEPGMKRIP